MRGQGSLEYLIITAAVLAISAVVVLFLTGALGGGATGAQFSACKQAASSCAVQLATTAGAACAQCNTACVDAAGKDIMSGASGCGVACGFCKQGKTMRVSGPLPAGIVGFWPFEENTGTSTADLSGNANTGTITSSTWTSGKIGNALSFDGTDDYVTVGGDENDFDFSSSFTIEFWMNPSSTKDSAILNKNHVSGYMAWYNIGWLRAYRNSAVCSEIPPASLPLNQWTHIAIIFNSAQSLMYANGALIDSDVCSLPTANTDPLVFGYYDATWRGFNGILDEIAIYNRALSADEITARYTAGR